MRSSCGTSRRGNRNTQRPWPVLASTWYTGRMQWTEERIDWAQGLYETGMSLEEIGRLLGSAGDRVRDQLRKRGLGIRGKGFYSIGERNPSWRGGKHFDKSGYVMVYSPTHPHRNGYDNVREHRLVMEKKLGRYLQPHEVVDHRNGVKSDNRLSNLRLFSKNGEHLAATLKGKCPKWSADGKRRMLVGGRAWRAKQKKSRRTLDAAA